MSVFLNIQYCDLSRFQIIAASRNANLCQKPTDQWKALRLGSEAHRYRRDFESQDHGKDGCFHCCIWHHIYMYIYILGQGRNTILQAEIGVFRNESGGWGKSLRVQHPEGKHYQSAPTLGQPQPRGDSPDPTGEGEGLWAEDHRVELQEQWADWEADQGWDRQGKTHRGQWWSVCLVIIIFRPRL